MRASVCVCVAVCLIGFAFAELQFNFTLAEALIKVVLLLLNHFEARELSKHFVIYEPDLVCGSSTERWLHHSEINHSLHRKLC